MKLTVQNDKIILFLNKIYTGYLNFDNKESAEKYLKKLFLKLQNIYNLEFRGYYNMTLFDDKNYGIVVTIEKEDLEYLEYFGSQIEFNTKLVEDKFLYEVSNIDSFMQENFNIYKLKDKIFIKAKNDLTNIQTVLEHIQKIIYGKEALRILKKAKKVRC